MESLVSDIPAGDGKIANLFYSVVMPWTNNWSLAWEVVFNPFHLENPDHVQRVALNVGGVRHEVMWRMLEQV